jgi:hypothetical protein
LQSTDSEIASVNLKCGPPFSAIMRCPASSNSTVITLPLGPGPASPYRAIFRIFDLGKMET